MSEVLLCMNLQKKGLPIHVYEKFLLYLDNLGRPVQLGIGYCLLFRASLMAPRKSHNSISLAINVSTVIGTSICTLDIWFEFQRVHVGH